MRSDRSIPDGPMNGPHLNPKGVPAGDYYRVKPFPSLPLRLKEGSVASILLTMAPSPLPIDPLLPDILRALEDHNACVVTAEPGAGKTTRVPPALLCAPFTAGKEVWVLQPRRIAAKLAALRVAEEMACPVGEKVGYQFRFENRTGPATRLKFMTDGMLLPLAQSDPSLSRTCAVILDEFHERSLALELGLGYLRRLQGTLRPDLRILVMSATLDPGALSQYLSGAPVLSSKGRVFPVAMEYHPFPEQPDLSLKVRSAVKSLLAKGQKGTTLVFLPGVGEIRKARGALKGAGVEVEELYGDLSVEEQQKVLAPSPNSRVILSTNVAETSLTVPGVTAVLDSGLTRQSRVSPWSGLESLVTVPASQASAAQRAGRAGRLQEGLCLRLYSKFDFEHRAAFDVPELMRSDLSKALLDLKLLGVEDLDGFPWFLRPNASSLEAAVSILTRLGALDPKGSLTPAGRSMARLPLPPRLARFLLAVKEEGGSDLRPACLLAAMIGEEEFPSEDLLEELKRFKPGFEAKRLTEQLEGHITSGSAKNKTVGAASTHLPSAKGSPVAPGRDESRPSNGSAQDLLAKGLLRAFPDRVAQIRSADTSQTRNRSGKVREMLLSTGGTVLAPDNALTRSHELFVLVEAQETQTGTKARALCPIQEDWLLDLFPDDLKEERSVEWNAKAQRVEGFQRLKYGQLVLDEKPLPPSGLGQAGADLLFKEALSAGVQSYCEPEDLSGFLERVKFVSERSKGFPGLSPAKVQETLKDLCASCRSLSDLKEAGLLSALRAGLSHKDQALLEKLAPSSLLLPSGRRLPIHYEAGKSPWAESRIQDFFGMAQGPFVAGGEAAVVLHLLSPAKRPVQVTSDLAGFWKNHYPQMRKELSRKYPRHKWPENPLG